MEYPFIDSETGRLRPFDAACSPFALLGIEATPAPDADAVKAAYRERSRKVHPDRFQRASADEQEAARQWSSALNAARDILGDARKTLELLLREAGCELKAEEVKPPQDLLMEVFDINEALDDFDAASASDAQRAELERFRGEMLQGLDASGATLKAAGEKLQAGDTEGALAAWQEVVGRDRYLRRIIERIEAALAGRSAEN